MRYKFIKINPDDEVYELLVQPDDDFTGLSEHFHPKIQAKLSADRFKYVQDFSQHAQMHQYGRILLTAKLTKPDYKGFAQKHNQPITISENGTFRGLSSDWNGEIIYSDILVFPHEKNYLKARICVCENDATAPQEWIDYLNKRFPDDYIKVIPYFRSRSKDELKEFFKDVSFVTFHTSFSAFDWFDLMMESFFDRPRTLVGYCPMMINWEELPRCKYWLRQMKEKGGNFESIKSLS